MNRDGGQNSERSYWMHGAAERVATGLTGLIAVLVALKAAVWTPGEEMFGLQNEFIRLAAFASLNVWATLTIGLSRRGVAAMLTMVFAAFVELVIMPVHPEATRTLAAAAMGIAITYLALQFYWYRVHAEASPEADPGTGAGQGRAG